MADGMWPNDLGVGWPGLSNIQVDVPMSAKCPRDVQKRHKMMRTNDQSFPRSDGVSCPLAGGSRRFAKVRVVG